MGLRDPFNAFYKYYSIWEEGLQKRADEYIGLKNKFRIFWVAEYLSGLKFSFFGLKKKQKVLYWSPEHTLTWAPKEKVKKSHWRKNVSNFANKIAIFYIFTKKKVLRLKVYY